MPAPEGRPCCSIGARPDAPELDALLLSGAESFGSISARTGINKGSLSRHRSKCLSYGASDDVATPAQEAAQPSATPTNQAATPQTFAREPALSSPTSDAYVTAKRIEDIANTITLGNWKDRANVVVLAAQWGVSEEEVQRLHRLAAAKCRANRGPLSAQAESSVGVVRALRDAALADAKSHEAAAKLALKGDPSKGLPPDYFAAKTAGRLASMARSSALQAQQHLDKITIDRRQSKPVQVSVSVTTEASFAAAWGVVRRILDARYPGASESVETGLAAWEDRGDDGVAEYLSELSETADATAPAVH